MPNRTTLLLRATRKERQLGVGPLWWSPGGSGYTDQVEDAGRFSAAQAASHVETEGAGNLATETEEQALATYAARVIHITLSPAELELVLDALHEAETEKSLDISDGFTDGPEHAANLQRLVDGWSALHAKFCSGSVRA